MCYHEKEDNTLYQVVVNRLESKKKKEKRKKVGKENKRIYLELCEWSFTKTDPTTHLSGALCAPQPACRPLFSNPYVHCQPVGIWPWQKKLKNWRHIITKKKNEHIHQVHQKHQPHQTLASIIKFHLFTKKKEKVTVDNREKQSCVRYLS